VRVPFIDLGPIIALVKESALRAWADAVSRAELVGGPAATALEGELARRLGVRHAVVCSSGTDAMVVGLRALGVGRASRVALPNLSFWASYEAVAQLGATPVLIDVDDDLQLDLEELARAFERFRFDAAVLVHLMGWASARVAEIRRFCEERGVALLEDGAQAFGVEIGGRPVFAGARVSTLSFYPAKVVGGCMDGGAVLTDDEALATLVRRLCNHGRTTHFTHEHAGYNARMGELAARWLLAMLEHADAIVAERRTLEARYRRELAHLALLARGHAAPEGVSGNGYLSVWTLARHAHEAVAAHLARAGVAAGRVYPVTIADHAPARAAPRISGLERSRDFARRVLDLPLYYGLAPAALEHVRDAFGAALDTVTT
jgi:dTDP-4-amino-4,6-dideoxygalactose transaminase